MTDAHARFYFDFVDPLSYLLELELGACDASLSARVQRIGFELRPPPAPLSDLEDPVWSDRWAVARTLAAAAGRRLEPPRLVPWTRKAHELYAHALEHQRGEAVRDAIFRAYFARGEDIGRIDRLVEIAASSGLDRSAAKAVLDVDRHEQDVLTARRAALDTGVDDVPTILVGGRLVRGFHNQEDLGTLLRVA